MTDLHPIVDQMSPSDEQLPAILARGCDVAVTAGAGTGKTRALVARYLSLLAEGLPLRAIAAITFTQKAAREMRNRVRDEVRRYLQRPDLHAAERQRWERLYGELDAARIGTIHSLCAEILRAHPAEAGVDPRFEVLPEGQVHILRQRALDEALAWAADDGQVVSLFALLGERGLRGTLASLIGQPLEASACLASLAADPWPEWQSRLLPPIQAFLEDGRVCAAFDALLALRADGTLDRAAAAGDRLAAPLRRLLALWDEICAARGERDWAAVSACLAPLRAEIVQVGKAANWAPADPKAVLKELQALYDEGLQACVGQGIDLALDRQLAAAMPALHRAFAQAMAIYRRTKEERRALDFDDLEGGALALLREQAAVRARWQGEMQAILVDEFQDTNGRQRDLVALLNGAGGRLFLVGDAKQSIYRFRGADVVVFRTERERIASQGGQAFALQTSYRAHQGLIEGLNDLLRPVLGQGADPDRPWAEPFAPLCPHRLLPGPGFLPPHIELHLAVGSKGGGALDRAADALAGRIFELVEGDVQSAKGGMQVIEEGRPRPLNYGDVAILCRASTSFGAYEDALERAGVPFTTVAGRGFYGRPEVRDLLNALQAVADPTDDLALAGLLRSPAFALSDVALYRLCQGRDQAAGCTSLWEALEQAGTWLDGEAAQRAERAACTIAALHARAGRVSAADLLKAFLDETGYRAALIQAGEARGARNVAKLLADAHASGIVGVGEFLEYVAGLRDSGTREGEARATAEGAVQIMSVHAAKGLEFPVVAIGDVTYGRHGGNGALIDPELGVLLPLQGEEGALAAIYRLGKARADDQEAAELDRLFYVAATRAGEKLILNGCIALKRDGTPARLGGWLGQIAGPLGLAGTPIACDQEGGSRAIHLHLQAGQVPVACTIYEPGHAWDLPSRRAAEEPGPAASLSPPLLTPVAAVEEQVDERTAQRERVPPRRVWRVVPAAAEAHVPSRVLGSLVHEALAAWRFPDQGYNRWAEARARGYGLADPRQLADAVRRSRQLLARFRGHPLCREMEEAESLLHEVPYSLVVDAGAAGIESDLLESGIVDALYLRGGAWTIVEFKTDYIQDEAGLEQLLEREDYLAQAARYVRAVERLLGQRPRAILCLLNYAGRAIRTLAIGSTGQRASS